MNASIYRQALEIATRRYGNPSDHDVDLIADELLRSEAPGMWDDDTPEDSPCLENPFLPEGHFWPEGY